MKRILERKGQREADEAFADFVRTPGRRYMADTIWRDGWTAGFLYGQARAREVIQNWDGSEPVDWRAGP